MPALRRSFCLTGGLLLARALDAEIGGRDRAQAAHGNGAAAVEALPERAIDDALMGAMDRRNLAQAPVVEGGEDAGRGHLLRPLLDLGPAILGDRAEVCLRIEEPLQKRRPLPVERLRDAGYKTHPGKDGLWDVILSDGQSIDPVIDLVRSLGLNLRHLVEKRFTLEDFFIATVDTDASES